MNFLSNLRISQKIMVLVAGLGFGFIAIGVAYYIQIGIESDIRQQRQELAEYEALISGAQIDVIRLNELLMQFIAYREPSLLEKQREVKQDLTSTLETLQQEAQRFGIAEALSEVRVLADDYSSQYAAAVGHLTALGNNVEQGLHQDLGNAATRLEKVLRQMPGQAGLMAYLQMRRLERDYTASPAMDRFDAVQNEARMLKQEASRADVAADKKEEIATALKDYLSAFESTAAALREIQLVENKLRFVGEQLSANVGKVADAANAYSLIASEAADYRSQVVKAVFIVLVFSVVIGTAIGVYFIYKSIVFPMAHIQSVIRRINKGNTRARVKLLTNDELGDLGQAFNLLLDERIQHLEEQSLENDRLNNSIISLIRALGMIAKKDLTIKVPVSPDITGTISDAVNLLTSETAKTLHQVKHISEKVNSISDLLQSQSGMVVRVAEEERRQVNTTAKALDMSAKAMNDIAKRAGTADKIASQAIANTQQARESVLRTVAGILTIRETISETEKRMKRLGERSQEISGIVNLINTIAERTHILALNASMHAASAGEAGKGFAVVADEVQRLAENARSATADISSMVNNIRVETSDTVTIMNKLISEVAEGTRLAEQAGSTMEVTEDATRQLVETVQIIAKGSMQQAELANKLRDRAIIIRNYTEKTGSQLAEQKSHTDSLKRFSEALVERVNVFALPHDKRTEFLIDEDEHTVQQAS